MRNSVCKFVFNKEYSLTEGDIYIETIKIETIKDEMKRPWVILKVDGEQVRLRRLSSIPGEFIRVNKSLLSDRSRWKLATRFSLDILETI